MASFTERIARHLDHPVDAACAARSPGTTWTVAIGAGLGAGVGSIVGGSPIWAGVGAALGVALGYVFLAARRRPFSMALVMTPDRLELLRLGTIGFKPAGVLRRVPYGEIESVDARDGVLELRVTVTTADEPIVVDTSKRGVGAGREFVDRLRARVSPPPGGAGR